MNPSFIEHHMRVTGRFVYDGQRWYQIFDTTLTGGYADYDLVPADHFEKESRLVNRPDWDWVAAILERTAKCRYVPYSIPNRTDCESVQWWIHGGHRWNLQISTLLAALVGGVASAYFNTDRAEASEST